MTGREADQTYYQNWSKNNVVPRINNSDEYYYNTSTTAAKWSYEASMDVLYDEISVSICSCILGSRIEFILSCLWKWFNIVELVSFYHRQMNSKEMYIMIQLPVS